LKSFLNEFLRNNDETVSSVSLMNLNSLIQNTVLPPAHLQNHKFRNSSWKVTLAFLV